MIQKKALGESNKSPRLVAFLVGLLGCGFISGTWADVLDDPVVPLELGDEFQICGTVNCDADNLNNTGVAGTGEALFTVYEVGPTGSGLINPFLRFQHNEQSGNGSDIVETAYNTDATKLQTLNDPNPGSGYDYENQAKDTTAGGWKDGDFNRAILYDDLLIDEDGYITFLLDINEPEADGKSTLRLDELSFFISTTPELNLYDPEWDGSAADPEGTGAIPGCDSTSINTGDSAGCFYADGLGGHETDKVWDMDLSPLYGSVLLDNVNNGTAGSGDYDLKVRLPSYVFADFIDLQGSSGGLYVYLENTAGLADGFSEGDLAVGGEAQAGFEEWAAVQKSGRVPVPGTLLLTGLGMLLFGRRLYS